MLLDNKKNGKVGDALKENLHAGAKLSVISGLFSIYGYESLKKELNQIENVRLLFSKLEISDEGGFNFQSLNGDSFERRYKNRLNQATIAKECANWLAKKADIKVVSNPHILNQNLFHIQNQDSPSIAIQGSSHFTTSGLGISDSNKYDMNMLLSETSSTKDLLDWFNEIWENPAAVNNIKECLL